MAPRSSRSPKSRRGKQSARQREATFLTSMSPRRRLLIGGATAFAVAFSYVSANAIWYQPHQHDAAFFVTRPKPVQHAARDVSEDDATVIRIEPATSDEIVPLPEIPQRAPAPTRPPAQAQIPADAAGSQTTSATRQSEAGTAHGGNDVVREVQVILAGLNLYEGEVDGLKGPQTRAAVQSYQDMVGLNVTGEIDESLLEQLGTAAAAKQRTQTVPSAAPSSGAVAGTDSMSTASSTRSGDPMIMRIQAGLRAFGNDGLEMDGLVGQRTRDAILEFQALFGLPKTGEPDRDVYAKMKEIGLTD